MMPTKCISLLFERNAVAAVPLEPFRGPAEVELLERASNFLLARYLGYDSVSSFLSDDVVAYERNGIDDLSGFLTSFQFPFPVESIKADALNNFVKVDYDTYDDSIICNELLSFNMDRTKIKWIQTSYIGGSAHSLEPRVQSCGGADSEVSIKALKTCRVLQLAMQYLKADITQDLVLQEALLTDDAAAFGERGKTDILQRQKAGIDGGVTYSVPFPVIVDPLANCVTLDFYAYRDGTKQKGTDIVYVDTRLGKAVRIDTLRHTLVQPEWVVRHFSNQS